MGSPAIELREVVKAYGSKVAVRGVSLDVRAGEIFAFLGPNGAGKTTTIKLIAGLLHADDGSVRVCGHAVGENGLEARACLAYVPDQPFLYEKLTGREYLEFVRQMYRVGKDVAAERVASLAARLDMSSFLDRLSEGYSHGMKQRVVLAGALLHDPDVLVIDEPMVGLDPRTVRTVKDLFLERTARGKTIFMSTHTLEVAEAVAHRIGIIHNGNLVRVGTFEELQSEASKQQSLEDIFLHLTEDQSFDDVEGVP
ncbi:MAG: ABC transporter ATP-binding protein [Planctomycetes bacterium]|nr:ABC transporter ATP-binding protein [Planctomycetota bacterium]